MLPILSSVDTGFDRLLDSLAPVLASILWIVSVRLINRWLPKDKNRQDTKDEIDEENLPDMPVE